jgi:hypothetical protein
MPNIPDKYNTDGLKDLANVWQDLLTAADGATEQQIYALAEDVVRKLHKPVTKENVDIVLRTFSSQIKINIKE